MDQVSFVDALLPARFGRNARLERIARLIDWAPIERLVAEIHPGETGRPPYWPLADVSAKPACPVIVRAQLGTTKSAVYLDKAFAYGITQGIVQVELAARNNRSRFRRRHDGRGIRRHRAFALQRKRRARSHAGARGRPQHAQTTGRRGELNVGDFAFRGGLTCVTARATASGRRAPLASFFRASGGRRLTPAAA